MKLTHVLAAGTAACAILSGIPALAQDGGPYGNGPQYSTPAEQQQTRALNERAIDGTTQSPAALNGERQQGGNSDPYTQAPPAETGPAPDSQYDSASSGYSTQSSPAYASEPDAYGRGGNVTPGNASQADGYYGSPQSSYPYGPTPQSDAVSQTGQYGAPSAQQQQYEQQLQQYDQQQNQYQDRRQRYDAQSARYRANLRAYDRAMYDWAYPAPIAYEYGDTGPLERLYLIAEPSQQLFQIPVEDPSGRWVGRVRNVETAPDGRPNRVEVALNRRVSVWVPPGDLRYDPATRVLFTDLSRDELWQMPGATVESGPL